MGRKRRAVGEAFDEVVDAGEEVLDCWVKESELVLLVELLAEHYFLGEESQGGEVGSVVGRSAALLVQLHKLSEEQL